MLPFFLVIHYSVQDKPYGAVKLKQIARDFVSIWLPVRVLEDSCTDESAARICIFVLWYCISSEFNHGSPVISLYCMNSIKEPTDRSPTWHEPCQDMTYSRFHSSKLICRVEQCRKKTRGSENNGNVN